MNGISSAEERVTRKRNLEAELEVIRSQKAEVLRAIQQIAKKQKLGGPPTKNVHLSHEGKIGAENRLHKENKKKVWQSCSKIIHELLKNSSTKLYFGEPVHGDKYPGYYDVIKKPMDLGSIKKKLESMAYSDVFGFREDVRLCFDNCRAFNPPGHAVRNIGDNASDQFERKWEGRQVEPEWETELKRHALAMERLEAEAKSLPDKIKEVDVELQDLADKAAARTAPLPPGPDREMTFEERRKLSHSLSQLDGERLARILELILDSPSAATIENDDETEAEIDLDSIDKETLWKIQAYVDSVNAELNAKAARPGAPPSTAVEGANARAEEAPRGQELTTFVSATGPGTQPQIMKNATQKKDVQLQNVNAWINIGSQPAEPAAVAGALNLPENGHPAEDDDDTLWTEFKGREEEQRLAEEQKKALEEEEREKEEAARRAASEAEEAQRRAVVEAEAAKKRDEEDRRRREAQELRDLNVKGAEDAEVDLMRQAGHGNAAALNELGLAAQDDDDDEEAMDI